MIDYIKGVVAECSPTYIVIENNGIGYMLNVSLTTHSQVQNAKGEVKLAWLPRTMIFMPCFLPFAVPAAHCARRTRHGPAYSTCARR